MPTNEHDDDNSGLNDERPRETALGALRRSPGYTPDRAKHPWGTVPEDQRLDWCRALLDFPTFFPGPMGMSIAARIIRDDRVSDVVSHWSWQADDFHRTRSKPDGSPAIGAVKAALADAGLSEDEIDYVNAHGTSTPENDKMEHLSLSTVFGERIRKIPVSSNKSMIGHTLSAAGAIEAAFSLMTMREGVIPPTINYDNPDLSIELDVVPNVKRKAEVRTVLSNSFGFGGQNTCLVMAREPV